MAFYFGVFWELFSFESGVTFQAIYYWQKVTGIYLDRDERKLMMEIAGKAVEWLKDKTKPKKKR